MNPNAANSSKIIHNNNSNINASTNKLFMLTATKKCLMQSRKSIRAIFEPLHKSDDSQSPQVRDIKESLPVYMTQEINKSLKMNSNNNSSHRKNRGSNVQHILQAIKSSKRPSIYNTINLNKSFGSKYRVRGASNSVSKQPSINMIKEKYGRSPQSPNKLQKRNKIIISSPSQSPSPSPFSRIFPLSKTKVSVTELTKKTKGYRDTRDAADTETKHIRTEQQHKREESSATTSYKMSEISNYNPHKDPQVLKLFSSAKVKSKSPNSTLNPTPSQLFLTQQTQDNENFDLADNSSVNPFKGYSKGREKRKNSIYEILAWKGKGGHWNGPQVKSSHLNKSSLFRENITLSGLKRNREQEFRSLYRRIKVTYFLQDEAYSNVMVPEKLSRVIQNLNNFEAELVDYLAVPDPHPQAAIVLEDLRSRRDYLVLREQKALMFSNTKASKTKEFPGIASSLFRTKASKRIPSTGTATKVAAKGKEKMGAPFLRPIDGSNHKLSNSQRSSSSYVTARKYSSKKIKIVGKGLVKPITKRGRKKIAGTDPSKFMSKAKVKEKQLVKEAAEDEEIYQKLKVLESFLKTRPKSKERDKMLHEVTTSISKFPVPSSVPILEFKTCKKIPGVNSPPVKTKWKKSDFIRLLPHPGEITKNVSEVNADVAQKRSQPLREDTKPYMSWLEEIMARKLENEIGVEVVALPDSKPKPVLKSIGTGRNQFVGFDLRGPKTGQFPRWAQIMTKGEGHSVRFKPKTEAIKGRTPPQLSVQHSPTTQTTTVTNNTTTSDMRSQQSVVPSPSNRATTNYKHVIINDDKLSEKTAIANLLGYPNLDRQQRKDVELNFMLDTERGTLSSAKNNSQANFDELNIQSQAQYFTPKNDSQRPTYFSALLNMDDSGSTDVSTLFQPKDTYGSEQMSVMSIHGNFMDIHNFKKRSNIIGHVREFRDRTGKNTVSLKNEPPATATSKSKYIHPPFQPGNLLSIVNFPHSLGLHIQDKRLAASNRVKFPIPNYYPPVNIVPHNAASRINHKVDT